jgi:ankyrin repeat protein
VLIDEKDRDGCTALHIALLGGHLETAQLLVEQGADVNMVCPLRLSGGCAHVLLCCVAAASGDVADPARRRERGLVPQAPRLCAVDHAAAAPGKPNSVSNSEALTRLFVARADSTMRTSMRWTRPDARRCISRPSSICPMYDFAFNSF